MGSFSWRCVRRVGALPALFVSAVHFLFSASCGFPGYHFPSPGGTGGQAGTGGAAGVGGAAAGAAGGENPSCDDLRLDGDETGIDCGGRCPTRCGVGEGCVRGDRDCASGVCTSSTCAAPSCTDGVRNGLESDIDCGGTSCAQCAPLASCNTNDDCESDLCAMGHCDSGLHVYYTTDTYGTTTRVRPQIYIRNEGSQSLALARLSVRYYLTTSGEDAQAPVISQTLATRTGVNGGTVNDATWQVVPISPVHLADVYVEVSFPSDTYSLAPGDELGLTQTISFADGSPLIQANDYSFDPSASTANTFPRIPLYIDGKLAFGQPPGG